MMIALSSLVRQQEGVQGEEQEEAGVRRKGAPTLTLKSGADARWQTNINLTYEEFVVAVAMHISLSGIICCARMVSHQSCTSTTLGYNLSITQLIHG